MSLHHFNLVLPAAMTGYDEHIRTVEIGSIDAVEVYFPLNNNRLSYVWFVDGERDIIPARNGVLTGNGNIQRFDVLERLTTTRLSMRGANEDPKFEHTIDAWINIMPEIGMGDIRGF